MNANQVAERWLFAKKKTVFNQCSFGSCPLVGELISCPIPNMSSFTMDVFACASHKSAATFDNLWHDCQVRPPEDSIKKAEEDRKYREAEAVPVSIETWRSYFYSSICRIEDTCAFGKCRKLGKPCGVPNYITVYACEEHKYHATMTKLGEFEKCVREKTDQDEKEWQELIEKERIKKELEYYQRPDKNWGLRPLVTGATWRQVFDSSWRLIDCYGARYCSVCTYGQCDKIGRGYKAADHTQNYLQVFVCAEHEQYATYASLSKSLDLIRQNTKPVDEEPVDENKQDEPYITATMAAAETPY